MAPTEPSGSSALSGNAPGTFTRNGSAGSWASISDESTKGTRGPPRAPSWSSIRGRPLQTGPMSRTRLPSAASAGSLATMSSRMASSAPSRYASGKPIFWYWLSESSTARRRKSAKVRRSNRARSRLSRGGELTSRRSYGRGRPPEAPERLPDHRARIAQGGTAHRRESRQEQQLAGRKTERAAEDAVHPVGYEPADPGRRKADGGRRG